MPLDGCELYTGIGLTNTYQLFTPENLILDDDLYHRARHAFLDIPMDEESLALDVIEAVGPGGHFLAQPHTRRHMRDAVLRAVSQEIGPDGQHYRDPVEVARERALDILDNYRPEPLADDAPRSSCAASSTRPTRPSKDRARRLRHAGKADGRPQARSGVEQHAVDGERLAGDLVELLDEVGTPSACFCSLARSRTTWPACIMISRSP